MGNTISPQVAGPAEKNRFRSKDRKARGLWRILAFKRAKSKVKARPFRLDRGLAV
jgi:hypothetical protein